MRFNIVVLVVISKSGKIGVLAFDSKQLARDYVAEHKIINPIIVTRPIISTKR